MIAEKGRIKIKGQINGFDFKKTLIPVKDSNHRPFVNQAMMKGGKTTLGKTADFGNDQDSENINKEY